MDLLGFGWQFVGFVVGFLGPPDTHLISVINELDANCQVLSGFLKRREPQRIQRSKNGGAAGARTCTGGRPVLDSSWTPEGHPRMVPCP